MAIDSGLTVQASDIERRGGLQYVGIIGQADVTAATADSTAGKHEYTRINDDSTAVMHLFEMKEGSGSLAVSGSKENGTMMFEQTISFYIPNCSSQHLHELEQLKHEPIICAAYDYNGEVYMVGLSEAYKNEDAITRNQTYAMMTGLEVSTGAAIGDEQGVTVTITCRAGELPRKFTGTATLDTSASTLTLD